MVINIAKHTFEQLGRKAWAQIHGACNILQCSICKNECITLTSGIHDVVNIKLGKPIFNRNQLMKFFKIVDSAKSKMGNSCPSGRRCK